mmetsp:Transcript_52201/g.121861  ORF Transcript_52201/g.121861 Transcript_52201/m.121861 type:complete len:365 (+) Transcript_52201:47-1141(+)
MSILRCRADGSYLLGVRNDSCVDGGWVGLVREGTSSDLFVDWDISGGTLRPRANPKYALCTAEDGCQNGGWLCLRNLGTAAETQSQWIVSSNCLRARGNPGFVLCARQDLQGIHMWSFDGPPDKYGHWDFESAKPISRTLSEAHSAGALRPVISRLREAVLQEDGAISDMHSALFLEGLQSLALVLELLGWHLDDFLTTDLEKLRRSMAKHGKPTYRAWLLAEVPLHAETGFKEYVDESAAMANLWVARNLDFFSQLFGLLAEGYETADCVHVAYSRTLQEHHSFLQRQAFFLVMTQLPTGDALFKILEGEVRVGTDAVIQELEELAEIGERITKFLSDMDGEIVAENLKRQEQFEVDAAYGRA